jgi:hypothetical protein
MVLTLRVWSLHISHHTDYFLMDRAQSSVQPLRYACSNDPIEEPGHQRKDSLPPANVITGSHVSFCDVNPLHANEARGEPGHGSSLPANEEWSEQLLLNYDDIELDEASQNSHPNILLPDIETQATTRQDPGDTRRTIISSPVAQSEKRFLTVLDRIKAKWKRFSQSISRMGAKSWTTETCSYFIAILALAGLITTLSAHQGKPLPQ